MPTSALERNGKCAEEKLALFFPLCPINETKVEKFTQKSGTEGDVVER